MPTMPGLTPEQEVFVREGERVFEEHDAKAAAGLLEPVDSEFQARIDAEAATSGTLMTPGPARDAFHHVMDMPYEEFETEFADVLNANADEDDGTEGPYERPPGPPVDSAAAYEAVDRRRRGELRGQGGEPAA